MSDPRLNDRFFKYLSGFIPGFKKQATELKNKAFISNVERKAHEPIACVICGKSFDAFNGFAQTKKSNCDECQRQFDDGNVCLVTMDSKRYAFVTFPEASKEMKAALAGKILTVTSERMDGIEQRESARLAKNNGKAH